MESVNNLNLIKVNKSLTIIRIREALINILCYNLHKIIQNVIVVENEKQKANRYDDTLELHQHSAGQIV